MWRGSTAEKEEVGPLLLSAVSQSVSQSAVASNADAVIQACIGWFLSVLLQYMLCRYVTIYWLVLKLGDARASA